MTAGASPLHERVMIVDDHDLFAESLNLALDAAGFETHRPSGIDADSVVLAARKFKPAVVLLDLQLDPDGPTGVDLAGPLTEAGAEVVIVTGVDVPARMAECLEAGAISVVNKSEPLEMLVLAVGEALQGRSVIAPQRRQELFVALREERDAIEEWSRLFDRLTAAESEVLGLLMDGESAEQVAERRVVSVRTVRTQIESILAKLEVHSQLGAVTLAHRVGWVP